MGHTVQGGASRHLATTKDGREFRQSLDVVTTVEEWEPLREETQEDDAGRPNIESDGLIGAFEQHLGSSKSSCACPVRSYSRS